MATRDIEQRLPKARQLDELKRRILDDEKVNSFGPQGTTTKAVWLKAGRDA